MLLNTFGKHPRGSRAERIRRSAQFRKNAFYNTELTPAMAKGVSFFKILRRFLQKHPNKIPSVPLPSVKTNLFDLHKSSAAIVWFGHSSYLISIGGKNILVDPVFSGHASPLPWMIKAFKGADVYGAGDLPDIDVLLITHDHYDHLDHRLMLQIKKKVKTVVCSLGVGAHLEHWGYAKDKINETDWHESYVATGLKLTAAPARHFSGRGIRRGQSLWSAFILEAAGIKLYLGGDSGYGKHFSETGKRYGPFDLAILECGQYNQFWPYIHMMPEETVQAAIDLGAKTLLPVHWGKFALAMHEWTEPIERVIAEADKKNIQILTPLIGEKVIIGKNNPVKKWWQIGSTQHR